MLLCIVQLVGSNQVLIACNPFIQNVRSHITALCLDCFFQPLKPWREPITWLLTVSDCINMFFSDAAAAFCNFLLVSVSGCLLASSLPTVRLVSDMKRVWLLFNTSRRLRRGRGVDDLILPFSTTQSATHLSFRIDFFVAWLVHNFFVVAKHNGLSCIQFNWIIMGKTVLFCAMIWMAFLWKAWQILNQKWWKLGAF